MFETHVRYFEVRSEVLAGNAMGNPSTRVFAALLPEGAERGERFPAVWMLDGYLGTGRTQLNQAGALGVTFADELIRWQREGVLPRTIFLFPDGSTRLGGSQYVDSISCGAFMRHIVEELVPFAERELPAIPSRTARAVAGHSSGGFGALAIAMLRPEVFGSVIASAADSAFDLSQQPTFGRASLTLARYGGIEPFLDRILATTDSHKLAEDDFSLLELLALGSCFSPAPDLPGWCELPFDPESAAIRPEVWAKWQSWDPVNMAATHSKALAQLEHLHLDCGSEDRYFAQFGHRRIARVLASAGIPHLHTEFPGGHDGTRYRYRMRFEALGRVFARVVDGLTWYRSAAE